MSNQKKLTVSILGKSYSIVTDEGEEIIFQAAQMLDSMMQHMANPATVAPEMVKKTTFVALQLAVDLVKKRQELELLTNKTDTLNGLLEEALGK